MSTHPRLAHVSSFITDRVREGGGGFIYMIECQGFIKIGVASNVQDRLATMQTGCPFKLVLLTSFVSPKPYEEEEWIHALLDEYRVQGEWFKLPEAMIQHLLRDRAWSRLRSVRTEPEYSI